MAQFGDGRDLGDRNVIEGSKGSQYRATEQQCAEVDVAGDERQQQGFFGRESGEPRKVEEDRCEPERERDDANDSCVCAGIRLGSSPSTQLCAVATIISTARAPAMGAKPGRVTVHCWSRVRSVVESPGATTSLQK